MQNKYNSFTPEQLVQMNKHTVENGPTRAAKRFSQLLNVAVPETANHVETDIG